MSQKKKTIVITATVIIIALAIIIGIIWWLNREITGNTILEGGNSKVTKLYSQLKEKQTFCFTTTLDEENLVFYAKKDNMAYLNTKNQGEESKFIVKDGNTYLLKEEEKIYYLYQNNETDLDKIILQLERVKDKPYTEGKEKIENKNYQYEEYEGVTEFLIKDINAENEHTLRTRFYFNGEQLVYIKTIIGDYQEIVKVDISYEVNNNLFEIPSDYKEV